MMAPTLVTLWKELDDPSSVDEWAFSTVEIAGMPHLRLGRGPKGPALLLDRDPSSAPAAPLRLANLSAWFGVTCVIESAAGVERRTMDVVVCTSQDIALRALFLNAAEQLLVPTSGGSISSLISDLVELFRNLRESPKGSVSGVWGELFIIWAAPDVDRMIDAWHSDPTEVFDFARATRRLEVKTSLGERRHHFSLEQVTPMQGVSASVVSIQTRPAVSGPSILELVTGIADRSGRADSASRLIKTVVSVLGSESPHVAESRFDDSLASSTMRVFDSLSVPRPTGVPDRVSAVKFVSDLSDLPPLPLEAWDTL